ncbi:hypothetical protein JCM18694_31630 [Prolixibacter denitrificans]|uniref:Uncharacterized protein n=1 Tax=Prolixibacter denitrificans TaxID=1541063 RepID=A0ABQ0ZN97_9BACT|nr:hypothetical protein JCM18694_31630 [Prolixibacter denitrificans]
MDALEGEAYRRSENAVSRVFSIDTIRKLKHLILDEIKGLSVKTDSLSHFHNLADIPNSFFIHC